MSELSSRLQRRGRCVPGRRHSLYKGLAAEQSAVWEASSCVMQPEWRVGVG